jgi:hypothetical protein
MKIEIDTQVLANRIDKEFSQYMPPKADKQITSELKRVIGLMKANINEVPKNEAEKNLIENYVLGMIAILEVQLKD